MQREEATPFDQGQPTAGVRHGGEPRPQHTAQPASSNGKAAPFVVQLRRLGTIMEPDSADPREAEGVLNPAVVRTPEGQLYLLPRLVDARYYSRIGLARVLFNRHGVPVGVERLGVALEPEAPYELNPWQGGCVEDPRVTYLPERRLYLMTYTAVGPAGPRIALAVSRNVLAWRRLGLARFAPHDGIDLGQMDNKDGVLFPDLVPAPDGRLSLALLHRPTSRQSTAPGTPPGIPEVLRHRPSMWISYAPVEDVLARKHLIWGQHRILLEPRAGWERLRVGAGPPPVRTSAGWLVLYHGVCGRLVDGITRQPHVRYCMGMLLLDSREPDRVLYRSTRALLTPRSVGERAGLVPHVVFPTGLDLRTDGTVDIYYGMADTRIGVARTHLAQLVPSFEEHVG